MKTIKSHVEEIVFVKSTFLNEQVIHFASQGNVQGLYLFAVGQPQHISLDAMTFLSVGFEILNLSLIKFS